MLHCFAGARLNDSLTLAGAATDWDTSQQDTQLQLRLNCCSDLVMLSYESPCGIMLLVEESINCCGAVFTLIVYSSIT